MRRIKPRNPVARAPIMRKGGVHQPSKKNKDQEEKKAIQQEIEAWKNEKK
ncbi:MAG: hypothetical protein Q9M22_06805 [Mariprofundaceae bacterium]|nr:hypothetical protein [Mariprofundaceae bacterium]